MRLTAPRGVTLIELVVAVAILSIGAVAAWRSLDAAQRGLGGQVARVLAAEVALNRAAELRLLGAEAARALPAEVSMGNRDWRVEIAERPTAGGLVEAAVSVTAAGQPGARLVVHVSAGAP